jgi:hypothetical protein
MRKNRACEPEVKLINKQRHSEMRLRAPTRANAKSREIHRTIHTSALRHFVAEQGNQCAIPELSHSGA